MGYMYPIPICNPFDIYPIKNWVHKLSEWGTCRNGAHDGMGYMSKWGSCRSGVGKDKQFNFRPLHS